MAVHAMSGLVADGQAYGKSVRSLNFTALKRMLNYCLA